MAGAGIAIYPFFLYNIVVDQLAFGRGLKLACETQSLYRETAVKKWIFKQLSVPDRVG